jgi:hypothetical protein
MKNVRRRLLSRQIANAASKRVDGNPNRRCEP